MPAMCQEPLFARSRCYLLRRDVWRPVRGSYPSFIAHTGSCARPNPSHRLRSSLFRLVFAGCCQPLLRDGLSQRYLRNLCKGACTHTPRCFSGAFNRFFPENIGLTSGLTRSAHTNDPSNAISTGDNFSRLQ